MLNLKEYIKLHKETITILLVLSFLSIFAVAIYQQKDNIFSFIYMVFAIISTLKIVFNKINA